MCTDFSQLQQTKKTSSPAADSAYSTQRYRHCDIHNYMCMLGAITLGLTLNFDNSLRGYWQEGDVEIQDYIFVCT